MSDRESPLKTPDGRYIVVLGRLWRASNPLLQEDDRRRLVDALMEARRAVKEAKADRASLGAATQGVEKAKRGLGECGRVWWDDGAPDLTRRLAKNTEYADWFAEQTEGRPSSDHS